MADDEPHADAGANAGASHNFDPDPGPDSGPGAGSLDEIMRNFAKMQADLAAQNGASPQVTDAITQALLMVLGSGPSIAAYQGLLQAQQANGIMFQNAVANQQKTNILGMAMTAKCVRYMMDPHAEDLDENVLKEHEPQTS